MVDAYLHICGEGSVSICGATHSYYVLLAQVTLKCWLVRKEFVSVKLQRSVCEREKEKERVYKYHVILVKGANLTWQGVLSGSQGELRCKVFRGAHLGAIEYQQ